jgi:2-dehydropantoate 2-reductase
MLKIGIIGTGAMACLFAARLHGNAEVCLVGQWREQIEAIRAGGLTYIPQENGQWLMINRQLPMMVYHAKEQLPEVDWVLVLVKSGGSKDAAALLPRLLSPTGRAVTLQNGLGNVDILAQTIGAARVVGGSTAQGAVIVRPGVVQHTGNGMTYLQAGDGVRPLADLFNQVGITTHLIPNVDSLIWGKLIVNAGINALTALLRVPNGFLATDPTARLLLERVVLEAAQVAQANGITLPYANPVEQTLAVARATAPNQSSMLRDVLRRAPTEIEAITGAILRYGDATHTATPLNARLYHLMQTGAPHMTPAQLAHALQTT